MALSLPHPPLFRIAFLALPISISSSRISVARFSVLGTDPSTAATKLPCALRSACGTRMPNQRIGSRCCCFFLRSSPLSSTSGFDEASSAGASGEGAEDCTASVCGESGGGVGYLDSESAGAGGASDSGAGLTSFCDGVDLSSELKGEAMDTRTSASSCSSMVLVNRVRREELCTCRSNAPMFEAKRHTQFAAPACARRRSRGHIECDLAR